MESAPSEQSHSTSSPAWIPMAAASGRARVVSIPFASSILRVTMETMSQGIEGAQALPDDDHRERFLPAVRVGVRAGCAADDKTANMAALRRALGRTPTDGECMLFARRLMHWA